MSGSASGLTVSGTTLVVSDDDVAPQVNLVVEGSPGGDGETVGVTEGDPTITVTVAARYSNDNTFPEDKTVTVSVGGGTATSGADYEAVPKFRLTIARGAGSATGTFALTPVDDGAVEGDETIEISGGAEGLTVNLGTVTLADNDATPTVLLSADPTRVDEGASGTMIEVTAAFSNVNTFAEDKTVTVSVGGGTAAAGTDYGTVSDFNITIPAGGTSATGAFTLTPTQDAAVEGDETITVSGAVAGLVVQSADIMLADDELANATLSASLGTVSEADLSTDVTVTLTTQGSPVERRVPIKVTGGTAIPGIDFAAVPDFLVTIAPDQTTGTATFTLTPTQDRVIEGDETILLQVAVPNSTLSTTVELTDDDAWPTVKLNVDPARVNENDPAGKVTVTAAFSNENTFPADKTVRVGVGGGAAIAGTDYKTVSGFDIMIAGGTSGGQGTFILTPIQDTFLEGDETIRVFGTAPDLVVDSATLALADDDHRGASLSSNPAVIPEGASPTRISVTLRTEVASPEERSLPVSVVSGTAVAGIDFAAVPNFVLTIAPHETTGTATFDMIPIDDRVIEGDETVVIHVHDPRGILLTTITLADDDVVPAVILSADPSSVSEGTSARKVTLTAELSNQSVFLADTTVTVSVGGGTATPSMDYEAVSSFDVTVAAGKSGGSGTFTLAAPQDLIVEGDETIEVSGSVPGLEVVGAVVTVLDDDLHEVILSANPAGVAEGGSESTVTVTATATTVASAPRTVTVAVGGDGDRATEGTDYVTVPDFAVTIPVNRTTGTGTFTLEPVDDGAIEGDETVSVTGAGDLMEVTGTSLMLVDDDGYGNVMLSASPGVVSEGMSATAIAVTAAAAAIPSARTVTVTVGGDGDGAGEGTDYVAVEDFEVTIPANETSGTAVFTLVPADDGVAEGDETISLVGRGELMTVTSTFVTLADDDVDDVILSVSPGAVEEASPATTVTVTAALSNGTTYPADKTVTVKVAGGTAVPGPDYAPVEDFEVTIAANETSGTGSFTLVPSGDGVVEGDETILLAGESGSMNVTPTSLVLLDTDIHRVRLSTSLSEVVEGTSWATVVVTARAARAVPSDRTVTVSVGETGDNAVEGTDYARVEDFDVMIPAHETSGRRAFTVAPSDDRVVEGDETISLTGHGELMAVTGTSLTLADNDAMPDVSLISAPTVVSETAGPTPIELTVEFSNENTFAMERTVTISVGGGVATPGTDYAAVPDFDVTIPAGESSTTGMFTLAPVDDGSIEGDELIEVSGAALGLTVHRATLTLLDDDLHPDVTLSVAPASVSEDAPLATVTVTATLSNENTFPIERTVTVSVGGGTATVDADYAAAEDFEVTIPAGRTGGTGTFTLVPTDDRLVEGDETIEITGAAEGLAVYATTVIVADNDTIPEVDLIVDPGTVGEDASSATVTVTARFSNGNSFPRDRTVRVGVGGGTATVGADYAATGDFEVTIPAGRTSGAGTFALVPTDDELAEGDETIEIVGTSADLLVNMAVLTLADDDIARERARALEFSLAGIGRTVATQAVDAIGGALRGGRPSPAGTGRGFAWPTRLRSVRDRWRSPGGLGGRSRSRFPRQGGGGVGDRGRRPGEPGRVPAREQPPDRRPAGARTGRRRVRHRQLDALDQRGANRLLRPPRRALDGRCDGRCVPGG